MELHYRNVKNLNEEWSYLEVEVTEEVTPGLQLLSNRDLKFKLSGPESPLFWGVIEDDYYGEGYGVALDSGDKASQIFSDAGLTLESTYTAKAAAATLDLCQAFPDKKILYWHTFNSRELDLGEPSENLNEEWVNTLLSR